MLRFLWRLLPWVPLLGGLIVAGALYKDHREQSLLKEQGLRTTGTIQWSSRYAKPCSSSIRVVYTASNGQALRKYFSVCSSQYRPGESIDVIYLPADPDVARLAAHEAVVSDAQKMVGAVVAALLIIGGAALLIAFRKRNERAPLS
jgi:hypothetical protein